MNRDKLKSIIKDKSKGNSVLSLQYYQMYFFERILARISVSNYKDNIILKGGLFLASIVGDDLRTTKDMDTTLKSLPLNNNVIYKMFKEVLNIELGDNVTFKILKTNDIRLNNKYNGYKISLMGYLDNIKINLFIEITTGNIITPKEIVYNYNSFFDDSTIQILSYNIETVIAEKIHSIIERGTFNTRMKDFYDLYILTKHHENIIDYTWLKLAIENTFNNRLTNYSNTFLYNVLYDIKNSNDLLGFWDIYSFKTPYDSHLTFDSVIKNIFNLISKIS